MNWEKERIERKNPIDFCWVVLDEKTQVLNVESATENTVKQGVFPLTVWLERKELTQNQVVLNKLNHSKEGYQLYLQEGKGITVDGSNNLRTAETPKGILPIATVLFNPDVYSRHCNEYKAYQEWLKERNVQRYVDVALHNQQIDGKNLLHCVRLIETGIELAKQHTINVRRQNAEYLISIRKGKVDLQTILDSCQAKLNELEVAYDESTLPNKADRGFWLSMLPKIRKDYQSSKAKIS